MAMRSKNRDKYPRLGPAATAQGLGTWAIQGPRARDHGQGPGTKDKGPGPGTRDTGLGTRARSKDPGQGMGQGPRAWDDWTRAQGPGLVKFPQTSNSSIQTNLRAIAFNCWIFLQKLSAVRGSNPERT